MIKILNEDNIKDWSDNAKDIIERFTNDGDFYREHVLNPAIISLLGNVTGKIILDAGSGQGYFCRMLTEKGAKVTGIEPAGGLIRYAVERDKKENTGITYIQADLSRWIGNPESFDMVVSNMVFMDIPDYQPAIRNCISVLKPGGLFVFSICHPCFEAEEIEPEAKAKKQTYFHTPDWQDQPFAKVTEYLREYTIKNFIGYSFHRTMSTYINYLIEQGCVIRKLVEPQLPEEIAKQYKHHERDFHVPSFLVVKAIKE